MRKTRKGHSFNRERDLFILATVGMCEHAKALYNTVSKNKQLHNNIMNQMTIK